MADLGMNARAWAIADACEASADERRIAVQRRPGGARLLDAGAQVPGGLAAGLALAEMCTGGLAHVSYVALTIGGESWPGVQVWTDHPAEACLAAQYAGWTIDPPGYFALGSGPVRALARVERRLFEALGYRESSSRGVLVLEARTLPDDEVLAWVASRAGLEPAGLTVAVAPTASLAGGTQVVARVVETGLHKMDVLGFDVRRVLSASGTAPVPPPARNDARAIGRTNDCILYGGQVRYLVHASDDELAELAAAMPACTSPDYGLPFHDVFTRYGGDFYKIDPKLFSPAEVWLTSVASGRTAHAGRLDPAVLRASLLGPAS